MRLIPQLLGLSAGGRRSGGPVDGELTRLPDAGTELAASQQTARGASLLPVEHLAEGPRRRRRIVRIHDGAHDDDAVRPELEHLRRGGG